MKHIKYLNVVLTIIAACLVLITLAVTGLLPTASAKEAGPRYVSVPVNADGSINVRLSGNVMDVNISRIGGSELQRKELPVNLSQLRGEDIASRSLPVDIRAVDNRAISNNPLPVVMGK